MRHRHIRRWRKCFSGSPSRTEPTLSLEPTVPSVLFGVSVPTVSCLHHVRGPDASVACIMLLMQHCGYSVLMDDGLADLLHRVVSIFGDLARRRHAAREVVLPYTHMRIIGTLEDSPRLTQHQLAQAVGLSDAATSRALRILSDGGLVDITTDPTHARRRLAVATPQGLELFHSAGAELAAELRAWLTDQGFPYEKYLADTQNLANLLDAVRTETIHKQL